MKLAFCLSVNLKWGTKQKSYEKTSKINIRNNNNDFEFQMLWNLPVLQTVSGVDSCRFSVLVCGHLCVLCKWMPSYRSRPNIFGEICKIKLLSPNLLFKFHSSWLWWDMRPISQIKSNLPDIQPVNFDLVFNWTLIFGGNIWGWFKFIYQNVRNILIDAIYIFTKMRHREVERNNGIYIKHRQQGYTSKYRSCQFGEKDLSLFISISKFSWG